MDFSSAKGETAGDGKKKKDCRTFVREKKTGRFGVREIDEGCFCLGERWGDFTRSFLKGGEKQYPMVLSLWIRKGISTWRVAQKGRGCGKGPATWGFDYPSRSGVEKGGGGRLSSSGKKRGEKEDPRLQIAWD